MTTLTAKKRKRLNQLKLLNTAGTYNTLKFEKESELFRKAVLMASLRKRIRLCKKCTGFNIPNETENAPGFGDLNSTIVFIGQSLCTQCMETEIPFTEASGYYIDAVLKLSNLQRKDVFITNVVKCHPPANRKSTKDEVARCCKFLREELNIIKPKLIISLGTDARNTISNLMVFLKFKFEHFSVKHPASFFYSGNTGIPNWIITLSLKLDEYKEK